MVQNILRLREDHTKFLALLKVIEHQIEIVEKGNRPNLDILSRVISYFRECGMKTFHTQEDVIFGHLMGRVPQEAGEIYGLIENYRKLDDRLVELATKLHSSETDSETSRQEFRDYARFFVVNERRNIEAIDNRFFEYAKRVLPPKEWAAIDRELAQLSDRHENSQFPERTSNSLDSSYRQIMALHDKSKYEMQAKSK